LQESTLLSQTNLSIFDEQSASYRCISKENPVLAANIVQFLEHSAKQITEMTKALSSLSDLPAYTQDNSCIAELEKTLSTIDTKRAGLLERNVKEELASAKQQQLELTHAETLATILMEVESYIDDLSWASSAQSALPKIRLITDKHNELFNSTITDRYVEIFKSYIQNFLHKHVEVGIKTLGRKGETLRQIVLTGNRLKKRASLNKVLSDGEQRAVALADFLTEATLDESCSVIVVDDPVTSFGLAWREAAAQALVEQAKVKQVVVLTHDLPFVYFLKDRSSEVDTQIHWIKRGDEDGKPGYVYLHNGPASEETYKTAHLVRQLLARAKKSAPAEQELLVKQGFGALRASYEAYVIFDLFKGAVRRFEDRIRIDSVAKVKWDADLAKHVVDKFAYLSRFIEAHLHSDPLHAIKPSPELLEKEISEFEEMKTSKCVPGSTIGVGAQPPKSSSV
ncbi:MAG: hypothetical protein K8F91_10425, partial [Candidatus Obscuribacterales bacterium]|nr:hypothetical protein [Candidatus Obscuribacterales bacterium]